MTARNIPLARRKLRKDARGATMVEFALILPLLSAILLGLLELGYQAYVSSMMQGVLFEAARMATVGTKSGGEIDHHVRERLKFFSNGGTIEIIKKNYADFTGVKKPEKFQIDTAPFGVYNKDDCFYDANNNGTYDLDQGSDGLGSSDDVVHYEIQMTYKRLVPVGGFLGLSPKATVTAATVLRNQPFAKRNVVEPAVVCWK